MRQKELKKQGTNAGNEPLIKKDFTELQKEQMLKKILIEQLIFES